METSNKHPYPFKMVMCEEELLTKRATGYIFDNVDFKNALDTVLGIVSTDSLFTLPYLSIKTTSYGNFRIFLYTKNNPFHYIMGNGRAGEAYDSHYTVHDILDSSFELMVDFVEKAYELFKKTYDVKTDSFIPFALEFENKYMYMRNILYDSFSHVPIIYLQTKTMYWAIMKYDNIVFNPIIKKHIVTKWFPLKRITTHNTDNVVFYRRVDSIEQYPTYSYFEIAVYVNDDIKTYRICDLMFYDFKLSETNDEDYGEDFLRWEEDEIHATRSAILNHLLDFDIAEIENEGGSGPKYSRHTYLGIIFSDCDNEHDLEHHVIENTRLVVERFIDSISTVVPAMSNIGITFTICPNQLSDQKIQYALLYDMLSPCDKSELNEHAFEHFMNSETVRYRASRDDYKKVHPADMAVNGWYIIRKLNKINENETSLSLPANS